MPEPIIFYLGPEGSHSQEAAGRWSNGAGDLVPCRSLPDLFAKLRQHVGAVGVVPIENSIEGPVTQTLDLLVATEGVSLTAAFGLPLQHCLLAAPGVGIRQARAVYSHPQGLAQCARWLDENMAGVPQVAMASTSEAARRAASEPGAAAVASRLAAKLYGLQVLCDNIQHSSHNETRFAVVEAGEGPRPAAAGRGSTVKSLLHLVAANRPGALLHLLTPFHEAGMNLSFIQSRPLPGRPWQYGFFIEAEGDISDAAFAGTLQRLREAAESVRLLGVYPSQKSEPACR